MENSVLGIWPNNNYVSPYGAKALQDAMMRRHQGYGPYPSNPDTYTPSDSDSDKKKSGIGGKILGALALAASVFAFLKHKKIPVPKLPGGEVIRNLPSEIKNLPGVVKSKLKCLPGAVEKEAKCLPEAVETEMKQLPSKLQGAAKNHNALNPEIIERAFNKDVKNTPIDKMVKESRKLVADKLPSVVEPAVDKSKEAVVKSGKKNAGKISVILEAAKGAVVDRAMPFLKKILKKIPK